MGYVVKHSSVSVNKARKKGNVALGVDADGYDKTSVSGFYAGVAPVPGFHNLVKTSASTDPDFYTLTDLELVNFANSLGGSVSDVAGAKVYLASRNDIMFTDEVPEDIITEDLIVDLDVSNLSSYPESGTNFYDLSGGGNNGTLTNGPTFNENGYLEFDGSNDYISCGSSTAGLIQGVNNITLGILFKIDSKDTLRGLIGDLQYYCGGNLGLVAHFDNFRFYNDTTTCYAVDTGATVQTGSWAYFVGTYDGSSTKVYSIQNGVLTTKSANGKTGVTNTFSSNFRIMRGGNYYTDGAVAKAFAYTQTLTQEEILQIYYGADIVTDGLAFAMDAGNLVSYESGSTSIISMTGSINGNLTNGTTFVSTDGGNFIFDGTNDQIDFGDIDVLGGASSATWEMWVKPYEYTGSPSTWRSGITTWNDPSSGLGHTWILDLRYRSYYLGFRTTDVGSYPSFAMQGGSSTTHFPDNEWAHYVGTYDGSQAKVYINGELIATANKTGNIASKNANERLKIGVDRSSTAPMSGEIPIVRLYKNKALSADEVLQNYNAQKARFTNPDPTLETDGEWLKIFRQYSGDGDFFSSSNDWAEAKRTNADNPQANKYSILDTLYRYKIDGKFTLKINYPSNGITNIWSQTNNPVRDDGSGGVTGYTAIDIDTTASGWGGLERYDAQNSTFLDGTLSPQSNWYYAIGSKAWSGATTFPGHNTPVNEVELWVKYK
jgi:hypothetical protein